MKEFPMKDFSELNLPASLSQALTKLNFQEPTPIQAQAIPVALAGKDLIGCAQTGTGKTAAFGIPLIARLIAEPQLRALILAPTRELALQITEVLRKLSIGNNSLWPALIMGGANMRQQMQHLRNNPRVLIATPGRLMDHMRQRTVSFERVGLLVLDEADQMLGGTNICKGFGPACPPAP
jgi:superfamily II DNA/RNA helicase